MNHGEPRDGLPGLEEFAGLGYNAAHVMPNWVYDIVYPVLRWLHMVSMTLIVGGTLFFELVLPIAIDDLKREQQLFALARARLVFRWVVWISVSGLLLSGSTMLYRNWSTYRVAVNEADSTLALKAPAVAAGNGSPAASGEIKAFTYVGRWAMAHIAIGLIAIVTALILMIGRRPPEDPVRWMRLNLVMLLVTIFLGSATRHFQLAVGERAASAAPGKIPAAEVAPPSTPSETQPAH